MTFLPQATAFGKFVLLFRKVSLSRSWLSLLQQISFSNRLEFPVLTGSRFNSIAFAFDMSMIDEYNLAKKGSMVAFVGRFELIRARFWTTVDLFFLLLGSLFCEFISCSFDSSFRSFLLRSRSKRKIFDTIWCFSIKISNLVFCKMTEGWLRCRRASLS